MTAAMPFGAAGGVVHVDVGTPRGGSERTSEGRPDGDAPLGAVSEVSERPAAALAAAEVAQAGGAEPDPGEAPAHADPPGALAGTTPVDALHLEPHARGATPSRSPDLGAIEVDVEIYVGGARYPLGAISAAQPGAILPLETKAGDPAVAAIKGRIVAWGEIVVMPDESLGFRVTRVAGAGAEVDRPAWLPEPRAPADGEP